jgi:hypothetical protein
LADDSPDVLQKLLSVAIPDEAEDEKRRLESLSKDQIIEELLRAKVGHDKKGESPLCADQTFSPSLETAPN